MIQFSHPEVLFLLLLLPALAFLKGRKGSSTSLQFSSLRIFAGLGLEKKTSSGSLRAALRLSACAAVIIALARPQLTRGLSDVEASGIDIMLAIDTSSSMESLDFELDGKQADRLLVVKKVVEKFIQERPNDRIGIVAFAARPYLAGPLTLDHEWLLERLKETKTGALEDGTAVGSAIAAASSRLERRPARSKLIVLLTDGMNNAGKVDPLLAAETAKVLNIRIYTVGAGSRGEAPAPAVDAFGRRRLVMAKVDIDENTLKEIARITGGSYYRATDTDSLHRIYDEINRLEKTTHAVRKFQSAGELMPWLAWTALFLIAAEQIIRHCLHRSVP